MYTHRTVFFFFYVLFVFTRAQREKTVIIVMYKDKYDKDFNPVVVLVPKGKISRSQNPHLLATVTLRFIFPYIEKYNISKVVDIGTSYSPVPD